MNLNNSNKFLKTRITLGLATMLAVGTMAGCDKQGDKQAVDDMVNARLDAEKTKAMAEDYAKVKEENTTLKARVAELEKQLAAAESAKAAQAARLAQAAKVERAEVAQTQHEKAVSTVKKRVTGANGSM